MNPDQPEGQHHDRDTGYRRDESGDRQTRCPGRGFVGHGASLARS
ncbi:hypothetical protein I553_4467 [Mycobacterium xenopi 4042]|uniref:Uncharacterized protein n=1 Tax=Mycobacterium xenopi 4042 TaxID=1299334 RepID=X8AH64_MYCXE|nr:hypothetical protein I553_4467 [Mycobacterium xenopi 4042]EUA50914.1 hypothetical protein I552_1855 [Mycobacterium xenopi 3993]